MTVLMGILVIILAGALAMTRLPVSLFPEVGRPAAAVLTAWPDAAPGVVESSVTRQVEQAVSSLAGIVRIESISQQSLSVVTVEFDWGVALDVAALEMRDRVELLSRHLPEGTARPLVVKFDPTLLPAMVLILTGGEQAQLREFADSVLRARLESLPGVAVVAVTGGSALEIAVEIDAAALEASGISHAQVVAALQGAMTVLPGGRITEYGRDFVVRSTGQVGDIDQLARVIVGVRYAADGGSGVPLPVRLMDIADISLQAGSGTTRARLNGQDGVVLTVQKATKGNAMALAQHVTAELAGVNALLPEGATCQVTLNQAAFTGDSLAALASRLLWGAGLAVLVAAGGILHAGGAIAVAAAIPVTLAATLALMKIGGLTLNLLTLGGLALAVGPLLYCSLLVVDGIMRRRQSGEPAAEAAINGAGDAAGASATAILTIAAVLLPLIIAGGGLGHLYREFALVVGCAIAVSGAVALTLVPAAASLLCRDPRMAEATSGPPSLPARLYGITIAAALRNRRLVMGFALLLLLVGGRVATSLGVDYLPRFDRGEFVITVQLAPGATIERTDAAVRTVEQAAMSMPEVRYVTSTIGASAQLALVGEQATGAAANVGSVAVTMVPKAYRVKTAQQVMAEIDNLLWLPGVRLSYEELGVPPGASATMPVEVLVRGPEFSVLDDLARAVHGALSGTIGLADVTVTSNRGQPEITIGYSAERLAARGLTIAAAATQVRMALGGETVGYVDVAGSLQHAVVIRSDAGTTPSLADLRAIKLVSPAGDVMRLDDVATISTTYGTALIQRTGGQRTIAVTASVRGRDLGAVMVDARRALSSIQLPAGYSLSVTGDGESLAIAKGHLVQVLLLALLLVYMVVAAQMESLAQALTVLSVAPLAAAGSAVALRVAGGVVSAVGAIGLVLLMGLVVNSSAVLVTAINRLRERGLTRDVAVSVAGRDRMKPILLASATAAAAMCPLFVAPVPGAELTAPIALAIAGGVVTGAFVTLLVVPVVYAIIDDITTRLFVRPGRDPLDASDLLF